MQSIAPLLISVCTTIPMVELGFQVLKGTRFRVLNLPQSFHDEARQGLEGSKQYIATIGTVVYAQRSKVMNNISVSCTSPLFPETTFYFYRSEIELARKVDWWDVWT